MDAAEALGRLGGVATAAQLRGAAGRVAVEAAVADGTIARATRGRYVLPGVTRQRRVAAELSATLSHLSAAQHHGWPVLHPPAAPWVTVPRHRTVRGDGRAAAEVVWADLAPADHADGVTSPLRTVVDCARRLPLGEALAVADSALRSAAVDPTVLRAAADRARGPGAARVRRVAGLADARAANPFESALRALTRDVPDLVCEPQVAVATRGRTYHPDLVDVRRRLAVEADSWGFHADRETHARGLRPLPRSGRGGLDRAALHLGARRGLTGLRARRPARRGGLGHVTARGVAVHPARAPAGRRGRDRRGAGPGLTPAPVF